MAILRINAETRRSPRGTAGSPQGWWCVRVDRLDASHRKAFTMERSGCTRLQIVAGGRESLERALLRAVVFDQPEAQSLLRRLTPAANASFRLMRADPVGSAAPAPAGEPRDAHRT